MENQNQQSPKKPRQVPKIGDYVRGVCIRTEETPSSKLFAIQFHREYVDVEYPFEGVVSSTLFDYSFEVCSTDPDGAPISHWYDLNSPSLLSLEIL